MDELGLTIREMFTSRGGFGIGIAEGARVQVWGFDFRSESVLVALERRKSFPEQDGIVGIQVLSRFNIVLDYPGRRLFLMPRAASTR